MVLRENIGAVILEGHVQGLANARALGEAGIPVVVVDEGNCIARYSRYVKRYYKSPPFGTDSFVDYLLYIAERDGLTGWVLYPSNDLIVYDLARHNNAIKEYYRTTVPNFNSLEKIYNKRNLLVIAQDLGVDIPLTYYPEDLELNGFFLKFPVIIKGNEGQRFYKTMGRKVLLADSKEALVMALRSLNGKLGLDDVFVQEILPWHEDIHVTSFTAFCIDGDIKSYWMGEKLREHPLRFGTATLCRSVFENALFAIGSRLLNALGYTGICEVEFLKDPRDGRFKLIEINPRTWLWVGLARACGINFPMYLYNYLTDRPTHFRDNPLIGRVWMNFWTDTLFSFKAMALGELTPGQYLRSLLGKKEFATLSWQDPMPFVMMTLRLPYLFLER